MLFSSNKKEGANKGAKRSSSMNTKRNKKEKKSKKAEGAVPKTVTDSIPYIGAFENGIIEVSEGVYSKSYIIPPINFTTLSREKQISIAEQYSSFLGSFDPDTDIQVTLYNRSMNEDKFRDNVLLPRKADALNPLRDEFNEMLISGMKRGKNNLETIAILTVSVQADNIIEANEKFEQIDTTVNSGDNSLSAITKESCYPMKIVERLDLLNTIYNHGQERPLYEKMIINRKTVESFSLENCAQQGISTKDVIAPSSFEFRKNYFMVGDMYAKSFAITNYPTWIKGTILTSFAKISTNTLVSVYFRPIEQAESIKMIRNQGINISESVIKAQKRASRSGYNPDLISTELQNDREEVQTIINDISRNNVKLFTVNFVITIFAKDLDGLKTYESQLKLIANMNLVTAQPMDWQQEAAFNSSLPIGNNQILANRLMNTEAVASIIPFNVKEMNKKDGMYYGRNAVSGNMILYNRSEDMNPNGCILGMPGAGKSFSAKREIINVLLNTDDIVYIIDPEREYKPLADRFSGSIVKISTDTKSYINPFDLNIDNTNDDDGDPVKAKIGFINSIVETMIGGKWGLSPMESTIIDRAVVNIYEPYMKYLKRTGKKQDSKEAPTLLNFYNELNNMPLPDAKNMALSLERYVKGTVDVFAHHTNVDVNNSFIIYDIKDIGPGLAGLGLQIAMDHIWNEMIVNFYKGKRTWVYVDEIHLLLKTQSSASNLTNLWKRARKWNGIPTAITQNVEDLLKTEDARTLLNNSPFVILLGQTDINRQQLSNILELSSIEQRYISKPKPGTGLFKTSSGIIPMEDDFPSDTELYRIMTTKPDERMY